jgi:hypothetical protein
MDESEPHPSVMTSPLLLQRMHNPSVSSPIDELVRVQRRSGPGQMNALVAKRDDEWSPWTTLPQSCGMTFVHHTELLDET